MVGKLFAEAIAFALGMTGQLFAEAVAVEIAEQLFAEALTLGMLFAETLTLGMDGQIFAEAIALEMAGQRMLFAFWGENSPFGVSQC